MVEGNSSCFSKNLKELGSAGKTEIKCVEHGSKRPRLRVAGVSYGKRVCRLVGRLQHCSHKIIVTLSVRIPLLFVYFNPCRSLSPELDQDWLKHALITLLETRFL